MYFNKSFSVGPTLSIGFLVVHIEKIRYFFVGINYCVFLLKLKGLQNHVSFIFLKSFQIMIVSFFFFKQIYLWGPYFIEKKPFQLMIKLFFFFFFSNKFIFGTLFH
jgi:hypothetical protein